MHLCVLTGFPQARGTELDNHPWQVRRSDSGAAVRRTRGGELGRTLGCVFAARRADRATRLNLTEKGCASAVCRTAGPARWAFGPPPERAARTRQNWAEPLVVVWADLLIEFLRLAEPRSPPPPRAADCTNPAPGYRFYYTGTLSSVGNSGFSWSSTTSEIYKLDLNFTSQYL